MWNARLGYLVAAGMMLAAWPLHAADQAQDQQPPAAKSEAAPSTSQAPETSDQAAGGAGSGSPLETAKTAAKGSLQNPYDSSVAEEGHKLYMAAGCNGCHGGGGGGGMAPPLTNPVWIYGNDDDTLFRLIALGSDEFQQQGYQRKGSENVVGPMPVQGTIVKSDNDMWKIIAWIKSLKS